jgi:hypothetical protein
LLAKSSFIPSINKTQNHPINSKKPTKQKPPANHHNHSAQNTNDASKEKKNRLNIKRRSRNTNIPTSWAFLIHSRVVELIRRWWIIFPSSFKLNIFVWTEISNFEKVWKLRVKFSLPIRVSNLIDRSKVQIVWKCSSYSIKKIIKWKHKFYVAKY